MNEFKAWIDKNPLLAGGIVFGVGLVILWWLGYFSSSSSSTDTSGNNLAAAYYAAEAASATAGTQLQLATVQATNQTAQVASQANAAVAINQAQQTAATTIAQYGAGVAATNANDAMLTANTAASYAYQTAQTHDSAMNFNDYINNILPMELQYGGGYAQTNFPGQGNVVFTPGAPSPAQQAAAGFSPAQIAQMFANATGTPA